MSCAHVREELGGYVLGALEPGERDAVAAHLATCPACAAEHERLAVLPDAAGPRRGARDPGRAARRSRSACSTGSRASAASGACVRRRGLPAAHARPRRRRRRARRRGARRRRHGARGDLGGDEGAATGAQYALVLSGTQGASARAELEPGRGGTEVHLWVKGLPPGAEAVYEVRCERSGWSASAGTFRADARGRAYVVLTTAARIGEYERIRVVRARPDDAEILAGEVQ